MNEKKLRRNIFLYYVYFVCIDTWFFGAILVTSVLQLTDMSLKDMYFMESVVMLGYVLIEVPSGALADYVGRKCAIVIGSTLMTLAMLWFASMDSVFDAWGANMLIMTGIAFCSGADRALLSDTLHALGRKTELTRIQSHAQALRYFVVAVMSLFGGYLAERHLRLPLYLCVPSLVFAVWIATRFYEPVRSRRHTVVEVSGFVKQASVSVLGVWRLMLKSLVFVSNNKQLKWIIGFFVLLAVSSKIWFFMYNPYFKLVELEYRYYGYIFCGLNLIACIASVFTDTFTRMFSERITLIVMWLLISVPILLMGAYVAPIMAWLVVSQNVARGFLVPIYAGMIDRYLSVDNKATVQSIGSATRGLIEFFALMGFSALIGIVSVPSGLLVLGVVTILLGLYALRIQRVLFV